jgi:hypothetical protein
MFVQAIEVANGFTRPIHSIFRNYESDKPWSGAGTLFMVNKDGWAVTCAHIAKLLADGIAVNEKYAQYQTEYATGKGKVKEKHLKKQLAAKNGYNPKVVVEIRHQFVGCVDRFSSFQILTHPTADLALIRFDGFSKLAVTSFPTFAAKGSDLKQGKYLCRLGFPFPEFDNFAYDHAKDETSWTATGRAETPRFPIEGMVTRFLGPDPSQVFGFEMSTPGLRGQSGGPAFDPEGRVWGMQYGTNHLDLDFDIDKDVMRSGVKKHVHDSAFLHVGYCVHIDVLKEFMRTNGVAFQEG